MLEAEGASAPENLHSTASAEDQVPKYLDEAKASLVAI